jgi:hypothetical protein
MRRVVMVIFGAILAAPALATAADSPIKIVALPYIDHELAPVAVDGKMVTVAGTVEAPMPGAEVVIEARRCTRGAPFRTVGAVPASGDGIFRAQVPAYAGTFFRARFGGATSATAVVRWPAPLRVTTGREYGALRIRTLVTVTDPPQSFHGRTLELQRKVGGEWVRVRRTRLVRLAPFRFRAGFVVWVRGLTVRVVLREAEAHPCYAQAVSRTLRS